MNYIVIISAIITVMLAIIVKFFNLSLIYPTLMLILTIILDIIANTIKSNKDKKECNNLNKIIKNNKLK